MAARSGPEAGALAVAVLVPLGLYPLARAYGLGAGQLPSPLLNVALCEKALFRYPLAIAALERALSEHGEEMSAKDKKAASDARSAPSARVSLGVGKRPPSSRSSNA